MNRFIARLFLATLLTLGGWTGGAAADDEAASAQVEPEEESAETDEVEIPARHRLTYAATLAARVNPLGLFLFGHVGFAERLYRSENPAFANNFAFIGVAPEFSPALARIGIRADVQPLSVLHLWAIWQYGTYFGNFDYLQSFQSPDDEWSDSDLDDLSGSPDPAARNYSTNGHAARLGGRFQIKFGNFALRNTFRAQWSNYDIRSGDDVYYDPVFDVPVENRGWLVSNDLDVAYLFDDTGWLAGLRYNWTAPIYSDAVWQDDPDGVRAHDNRIHRLGPTLAYTFDGKAPAVKRPTLLLILNWHLTHRYRTGADVSQALPYIGIAFLMRGDVWSAD